MKKPARGYTLVEVMIVVAILAVIAAFAIPGYDAQMKKAHRSSAQQFMVEIANKQAQYLLDARNYAVGPAATSALTTLGLATPPSVSNFYDLSVTDLAGNLAVSTPPSFKISATPKTGTKQEGDGVLTLDHTGAKMRGATAGW